jgi:hypothetical protein
MKGWLAHRDAEVPPQIPAGLANSFSTADRADCCPAPAAIRVIMPPTATRPHPADLLLCHHHYRESEAVFRAAGASAYDSDGIVLMCGDGHCGLEAEAALRRPVTGAGASST